MSPRLKRLTYSVAAGLGLSLIVTAIASACTEVTNIDFHVFYESAEAWRHGRDLYATEAEYPNLNPPHFVVAFAPLTVWPEETAIRILMALNVVCLFAAVRLIWRELALPRSFAAVCLGVAVAGFSVGLILGLEEGHPIGVLILLTTGAWVSHRRNRVKTAGVLVGTLIGLKPFFGCLLLVPLAWGHYTMVAVAVVTAGLSILAGPLFTGWSGLTRWLETGSQVTWFYHPLNASLAGLFDRAGLGWKSWAMTSLLLLAGTALAIRRSRFAGHSVAAGRCVCPARESPRLGLLLSSPLRTSGRRRPSRAAAARCRGWADLAGSRRHDTRLTSGDRRRDHLLDHDVVSAGSLGGDSLFKRADQTARPGLMPRRSARARRTERGRRV